MLPVELVESATRAAFERYGSALLQYGEPQGFAPFLKASETLLNARGVECDENQTFVSTGGSGGLNNIAMAILEPGRTVLVERPTYTPAMAVFRGYGANVVEVDTDQDGLRPEALADKSVRYPGAVLYVLPTFQNPTGRTMPADRRADIAEVIRRFGTLAIEDDVYADLRFRGEPVRSLYSHAPDNVVYLTSMSKTVAPALRLGIATMPPKLLDAVLRLKPGIDMQTSTLPRRSVPRSSARAGSPTMWRGSSRRMAPNSAC
ncbi:PLP-dependent aminotransferase family protein [Labedaea rhizosphaerae]|uniref:Aminotransferase class I and II n=1 Tax=Labedaea rhizosphaerae TaxID=598644 RepID=A0A4R6SG97_LABRH|nr:aminotransferase class I and II [Labedaea rhizosphaerae]